LLPSAVYWEYAVDMESWEQWEDPRRPWEEDWYSIEKPTPGIIVANWVLRLTVLPAALVFERHEYKTEYGFMALEGSRWGRGGSFHHNPPPLIMALEWWRYGLPFWIAVIALLGESGRWTAARAASHLTSRCTGHGPSARAGDLPER
jgi:hypothetical protein